MPDEEIQSIVRNLTVLWHGEGKNINAEELRKWLQPHKDPLLQILGEEKNTDIFKKLINEVFPEGEWQGSVALNQVLYLIRAERNDPQRNVELLKKFYDAWARQPLNLSALLVRWRDTYLSSRLDPEIILETITYDPSVQSYFDPEISKDSTDFFINMYRDHYQVEIDRMISAVSKLVGERHVSEFFRLVDIDKPLAPEEFVKRVEKALDVMAKAKEQGLDIGKIFAVWDEMADEGGERLEKLSAAVKKVAEEAVKERFWEELMKRMNSLKVPVVEKKVEISGILSQMHSVGLLAIKGSDIELSPEVDEMLGAAVEILLKTSPSTMYTTEDVLGVVKKAFLEPARKRDDIKILSTVLQRLDVLSTKWLFEKDERLKKLAEGVLKLWKRGGVKEEEVLKAVEDIVHHGTEIGEDFDAVLQSKIRELKEER